MAHRKHFGYFLVLFFAFLLPQNASAGTDDLCPHYLKAILPGAVGVPPMLKPAELSPAHELPKKPAEHDDLDDAESDYAGPSINTVRDLVRLVDEELQIKPEPISVAKAKKMRESPFEDFVLEGKIVSYAELPPIAKRTSSGSTFIFFGRLPAATEANAMASITRYFTEGLARTKGHSDLGKHQESNEGAARSIFSNGSEGMDVRVGFAQGSGSGWGVLFVMDTAGQDILNLTETRKHLQLPKLHRLEREIVYWGSRSPQRVVGAVLFDHFKAKRLVLNPNYKPYSEKQ